MQLIPILQNFIYNCVHFSPFTLMLFSRRSMYERKKPHLVSLYLIRALLLVSSVILVLPFCDFSKNCWWLAAFRLCLAAFRLRWFFIIPLDFMSPGICWSYSSPWCCCCCLSWILAASLVSSRCFSTWRNKCSAWLCLRQCSSASVSQCCWSWGLLFPGAARLPGAKNAPPDSFWKDAFPPLLCLSLGGPAQDLSNFQMAPIPILSVLTCSTS